jgi:hypothetical protein
MRQAGMDIPMSVFFAVSGKYNIIIMLLLVGDVLHFQRIAVVKKDQDLASKFMNKRLESL